MLGSSINIAALVTGLFAKSGVRTFTPFYDSRMLRLVANLSPRQRFQFRNPKSLPKRSLERHGHAELAYRSKKSFGQPIFEWLGRGGQLEPLERRHLPALVAAAHDRAWLGDTERFADAVEALIAPGNPETAARSVCARP